MPLRVELVNNLKLVSFIINSEKHSHIKWSLELIVLFNKLSRWETITTNLVEIQLVNRAMKFHCTVKVKEFCNPTKISLNFCKVAEHKRTIIH